VFPYPGTTPTISANGTLSGIVWAAENGAVAVLHAYDAGDLSNELYNSNQAANGRDQFGAGNKYIVPTVANGKVYVGTTNGVGVFGLRCSYAVIPRGLPMSSAGGAMTLKLTATNGCAWSAASNSTFVSILSGASGTGSGSVSLQVAANQGPPRRATLTIADQTIVLDQQGERYLPPRGGR
jgi:hypothetical protein